MKYGTISDENLEAAIRHRSAEDIDIVRMAEELKSLRIELNGYRETESTNVACFDKVLADLRNCEIERDVAKAEMQRLRVDNHDNTEAIRNLTAQRDAAVDRADRWQAKWERAALIRAGLEAKERSK